LAYKIDADFVHGAWAIHVSNWNIETNTHGTFSGGRNSAAVDVDIYPWVYHATIAYRF